MNDLFQRMNKLPVAAGNLLGLIDAALPHPDHVLAASPWQNCFALIEQTPSSASVSGRTATTLNSSSPINYPPSLTSPSQPRIQPCRR